MSLWQKVRLSIACEICVTTDVEHEFGNVMKCLEAAYTHVVVISPDERQLTKLRESIEPRLPQGAGSSVRFLTPDALFTFVQGWN